MCLITLKLALPLTYNRSLWGHRLMFLYKIDRMHIIIIVNYDIHVHVFILLQCSEADLDFVKGVGGTARSVITIDFGLTGICTLIVCEAHRLGLRQICSEIWPKSFW